MLNCTLLLDSASRFGLKEGNHIIPCDAKKRLFLVSLFSILNARHWGFFM